MHFTSAHPKPPLIDFATSLLPWHCFTGRSALTWWPVFLDFFIGEARPQGHIFRVQFLLGPLEECKTFPLAGALVSTYNTTSYNLGARLDIWKSDTYSGPINKHGYSHMPEIFRAMEAIGALQREAAAKNKDTTMKKNSGTINVCELPKCMSG